MGGGADDLWDAYLDDCLAGRAEDPDLFLARHPEADDDLRTRIRALHALHAAAAPAAAPQSPSDRAGPAPDGVPFERLGAFRLVRPLDEGGMGTVYLARQDGLDRDVALKVMRPELRDSPTAAERFRREGLAVARLRHPHIAQVHAVGEERGVRFLAMELVPGRTLADLLAEAAAQGRTLPVGRVLRWGAQLARALHCAHEAGIVHRDVKPANVRIAPDDAPSGADALPDARGGRAVLLDFGVARDEGAAGPALTTTFAGSPLYAAPEHLAGAPVDPRSDVYALGVTLYQALTGRVPFTGDTMEQVLARALVDPPAPLRRLNPSVSREAELVVLTALEKEPARRYATAAAFADDLDAAAAGRPVSARAPGIARRALSWARRRAALASVLATAALGTVGAAALYAIDRRTDAEQRSRDAQATLDAVRVLLDRRVGRDRGDAALEARAAALREEMRTRHFTETEERAAVAAEDEALRLRRERETFVYDVLERLRAAEQLDPEASAGAEELRARVFALKVLEARSSRDRGTESFYLALAERHDRSGRLAAALRPSATLSVRSDPPGAEVHVFRSVDVADAVPGADHRLVAVPFRGTGPLAPDRWALRVVRGAGGVETGSHVVALAGRAIDDAALVARDFDRARCGDRLVAVDFEPARDLWAFRRAVAAAGGRPGTLEFERDGVSFVAPWRPEISIADAETVASAGGVPATVVRGGVARDVDLPAGLVLRRTAAPAIPCEASLAGGTPLDRVPLEAGRYVLVVRTPAHDDVRVPILAEGGAALVLDVPLPREGSTPPGWVLVVTQDGDPPPFVLQEREVTCAEYLAFVNDPAVGARIAASPEPILVPRTADNRRDGGFWERDAAGRFALPRDWDPEWPVLGVSHDDALAYAAWLAARETAQGRPAAFRLPTLREWTAAGGALAGRDYPFGDRFSPRWAKSCFSRPKPGVEPVRSFAADEAPCGAFDLAGGVAEWLDAWYGEGRVLRRLGGSSWAQADPAQFRTWAALGLGPATTTSETGFRLVRVAETAR